MLRRRQPSGDRPGGPTSSGEFLTTLAAALARSAEVADRSYLLRALARDVVCLASPAPEGRPGVPVFGTVDLERLPLPVADGRDGRKMLLAFTSAQSLYRWYGTDQKVWLQIPAGELARFMTGTDVPWFLDPADRCNVVLEPVDVATVGLLAEGKAVPEAMEAGPASVVLLRPFGDRASTIGSVIDPVASRHPIRRVLGARASFEEPRSLAWLAIRVEWDSSEPPDRSAVAPAMQALVRALQSAIDDPCQLALLGDDRQGRWIRDNATQLWPAG